MKRKTIIWLILVVLASSAALLIYREYNRTNKDLAEGGADAHVPAVQLISEYEKDDALAEIRYQNKILEISGNIKGVDSSSDHFVIVLGETGSMSSVRCMIDTKYLQAAAKTRPGEEITIRGAITGYKKDDLGIGSDVELNRCVIIK